METQKEFASELIIDKIGGHHRYQYIIAVFLFCMSLFSDNMISLLTLMTSMPIVSYTDLDGKAHNDVTLTYEVCHLLDFDNHPENIEVNYHKSIRNWAIDYDFYCSQNKASIISSMFMVGACLGLISVTLTSRKYSKEFLLKVSQAIFCCSYLIIFIDQYWSLVIMTFIHGFCQVSTYVLKNSILTELTHKDYRSRFTTIVFMSAFVIAFCLPFIYELGKWKAVYLINGSLQFIILICLYLLILDNPRNLLTLGLHEEAIENSLKIAKFNGKLLVSEIEESKQKVLSEYKTDAEEEVYTETQFKKWYSSEVNPRQSTSELKNLSINIDEKQDKLLVSSQNSDSTKTTCFTFKFKMNYLYLFMMLALFSFSYFTNIFELSNYSTEPNFKITFIIGTLAIFVVYVMNLFLMNSRIGRKGTVLLGFASLALVRLICLIFFQRTPMLLYFVMSSISNGLPGVIHTFVTESLTNEERVTVYSIIFLLVKLIVIAVPPIVKYSTPVLLCIIYTVIAGAGIVVTLFTKETRGLLLADN